MDSNRVFLDIPYSLKDDAKKYKIKWDADNKTWYSLKDNRNLPKLKKVYLIVPFNEKDFVKQNGGCWDVKKKCWYTLAFNILLTDKYEENSDIVIKPPPNYDCLACRGSGEMYLCDDCYGPCIECCIEEYKDD